MLSGSLPKCPLQLTQPLSDYAMPQEVLTYKPVPEEIGRERERKIKCYSKLTAEEQKRIAALEAYFEQEGEILDRDMEPFMLPYLFGKTSKDDTAIAAMRLSQAARWRKKTFSKPWVDMDFLDDLNTGCFYFGGRDKALRPLFVVRIDRVLLQNWDHNRMIRLIIFMLEFERQHLLVPGVCEQHVLLLDLRNVGLLDITSSRTLIAKIANVVSSYYVGMNYKILIVHPPASLQAAWGVVSGLLSEGQLAKACVVTPASTILTDLFAPHQLEQTYGGARPDIRGPYYPFRFVAGPFDALSQGPDQNAPVDIHSKLLKPPWILWKSARSEIPLQLMMSDDAGRMPRVPSDVSHRSFKTIGSFKSALSRSESFKSAMPSHHSFHSIDSGAGRSSCDAKFVRSTVEPEGQSRRPEGYHSFSDPGCPDAQNDLSDHARSENEVMNCSLEVEKAGASNVGDDDPLSTGSTEAPYVDGPEGEVVVDDGDEWGFAESPDLTPPVVFFQVAPERSRGAQAAQTWCFWPFCCPTGPSP
eukprot:gnl/MRDRNA2_/MRDRNA2_58440_c0_seq2.p1 gnl/MRDRNA2_/MRDRNA2_58440_c0~~gnl/MRDRNA2_/MRDRNA2_58440_c0_seq2.p1  ORF type:complete len:528 (-),score=82.20 gnl/MRDRNA2_/MRDRNA2_58440_c0_seq2:86-1669(-)